MIGYDQPTRSEIEPIISLSQALSRPTSLADSLATMARAAADLMDSQGGGIFLRGRYNSLRFVGLHGLSSSCRLHLAAAQRMAPGLEAFQLQGPVRVSDTEADARGGIWTYLGRLEGFRALMAFPVTLGTTPVGTVVVYRKNAGPWSEDALAYLELVRNYVTSAVLTARAVDDQEHELSAQALAVHELIQRRQVHFQRLLALRASLDSKSETGVDEMFADCSTEVGDGGALISRLIRNRVVAGTLVAEAGIAARRQVQLRIDRRSRLTRLPRRLGESDAVSIISNLLQNSLDAVAGLPSDRRRISLLVRDDQGKTVIRVRDWGVGLEGHSLNVLSKHGFTTKGGHTGMGLAIIADLVAAAGGTLIAKSPAVGTAFEVVIPDE